MNKYLKKINSLHGEFVYSPSGESPRVVSEEQIRDAEHQIGYPLPDDYKEFIRDFGGFTFWNVHSPSLQDHSINTFYGLNIGDHLDVMGNREFLLSEDLITPDMLPIAGDSANNRFLLFLDGKHKGSVYFWMMDNSTVPFS